MLLVEKYVWDFDNVIKYLGIGLHLFDDQDNDYANYDYYDDTFGAAINLEFRMEAYLYDCQILSDPNPRKAQ